MYLNTTWYIQKKSGKPVVVVLTFMFQQLVVIFLIFNYLSMVNNKDIAANVAKSPSFKSYIGLSKNTKGLHFRLIFQILM